MAVTFDALGPGSTGHTTLSSSGTETWTHTPTGTPTAVLVGIGGMTSAGGNPTTMTATYGGTSMTLLTSVASGGITAGKTYLFGLAGPASGAQTVSITCTATNIISAGSVSYLGTGTTGVTAFGTTATSNTPTGTLSGSVALTGTSASNRVFGCWGDGQGNVLQTVTAGNKEYSALSTSVAGADGTNTGVDIVSAVGTVTISFSWTPADDFGACAVELLVATAPPAAGPQPLLQPAIPGYMQPGLSIPGEMFNLPVADGNSQNQGIPEVNQQVNTATGRASNW